VTNWAPADGVLPLAEGVLRERSGGFPTERPTQPSARTGRIAYLEKKIQTKDEVLAELMAEHVALKKKSWGTLTGVWVPNDTRDQIVDFSNRRPKIGYNKRSRFRG